MATTFAISDRAASASSDRASTANTLVRRRSPRCWQEARWPFHAMKVTFGSTTSGGVRSRPAVAETPAYTLVRWRMPAWRGERPVVGFAVAHGEDRVTTAIHGVDAESRRVVTASGRVHALNGPPERDPDSNLVLGHRLRLNHVASSEVTEATTDVCPELCWSARQ